VTTIWSDVLRSTAISLPICYLLLFSASYLVFYIYDLESITNFPFMLFILGTGGVPFY